MAELSQNKEQDLKAALTSIKKAMGQDAIMQLGEKTVLDIPGISTGSLTLDLALGGRGLPRGRIIEIYGAEASGKTTVALHAVANAQKQGGVAAYIDTEHALDPSWAKKLGVDLEALLVSQPSNAEDALRIAEMLIKSNAVDIIVLDSVAALVPKAELDGEIGDAKVGVQARLMSQALRILNPAIAKTQTCMLFINQIRQKIGVLYGDPTTTSGGLALKFYSSVRIEIRRSSAIKESEEEVGFIMKSRVVKNKIAPPFRRAEFELYYDRGINRLTDVFEAALTAEVITKRGNTHLFGDTSLGVGRANALAYIKDNESLLEAIAQKVLESRGLLAPVPAGSENGRVEEPTRETEVESTPSRARRRGSATPEEAKS
jgi:recombination protein RecA